MFVGGYCGGMGLGGWLLMIGFWMGFLGLVVWVVTRLFPSSSRPSSRRSEVDDVLDRRLATGEIDPETYRQLRMHLVDGGRSSRVTDVSH